MNRTILITAASALALALGACGSGEEESNQLAGNDMDATIADSASPFADAEMRMNDRMMTAVGSDAGDNWARKMIEHHQGAIDMSEVALRQNPKPDVAEMARMTIEKNRKDMEDIRKLLKEGAPDQQSADLYRPAMTDMQQKMQTAVGADASETYMRKMVEHHKGAVAMSDVALQNGVSGAVREQVQKTRDANRKDAEMVEAMLRGEPMQDAMQQSGAKSAEEARAEPAPADKAQNRAPAAPSSAAAPKPTAKPAPEPSEPADPHAGHDMNNMQ